MFLLSMKAAGVTLSLFDYDRRQKLAKAGYDLEKSGIEANMAMARAEAAQETADSLRALNEAYGAQLAAQSARGTATNIGSAFFVNQKNVAREAENEKNISLNLLSKQAEASASLAGSSLKYIGLQNQLQAQFTQQLMDMTTTSSPVAPNKETPNTGRQPLIKDRSRTSYSSAGVRANYRASFGLREANL